MSFWHGNLLIFDLLIMDSLANLRNPVLDSFFLFITYWGSPLVFIGLSLLALIFLLYKRHILEAIYLNLCLLGSWQLMRLLKEYFARPRPSGEHLTIATSMSFPSGHAMLAIAFYGFIAYLLAKRIPSVNGKILSWILWGLFIILIGLSRVYLNVHYPSDILAGYIFGGLNLWIFIRIYKWHSSQIRY
ncbi:MAG TPA: phosphatase PAP2 family protein [Syntrophomonadaceae bacterium]|nr:phosphatase PAP2 family protein [Syntrophomonadaceae bacterium]